jgi:tRNA1(Val) A37 N6-methylase TrmN6
VSEALSCDGFLGGRVRAWQPVAGYRAATDPVFLAAACPARAGDTVLELGCGAGVAALCLAERVPGVGVTGVERQADYTDLARRNAAENGVAMTIVAADLTTLPTDLRQRSFDHVIANPPYYGTGTAARDPGRDAALREDTPLADWVSVARARLRPKGWLTMIQAADRLPDCLTAMQNGFGAVTVLPLAPRKGRAAGRVIIRARKGAAAPFRLLAPLVVHEGPEHTGDGDDFSTVARAVLRDGAGISMD